MSKYVTANLNRPTDNWRKVYRWYRVISALISIFCGVIVAIPVLFTMGYIAIIGAFIFIFISYYLGLLGGVIANGIRHIIQPKSIRLKNPSVSELLSLKFYWSFGFQFLGVFAGSTLPTMIAFSILETNF